MGLLIYAAACFLAAFISGAIAVWHYSVLMAERERARLSDAPVVREIA